MPGYVATYTHGTGAAVAVVLLRFRESTSALTSELQLLGRELAMQVLAMKPVVVAPIDLDEEAWLHELSKLRGSPSLPSSAPDRLAKFQAARESYERNFSLLKQPFIKTDRLTVEERIAQVNAVLSESIEVVRFSIIDAREIE